MKKKDQMKKAYQYALHRFTYSTYGSKKTEGSHRESIKDSFEKLFSIVTDEVIIRNLVCQRQEASDKHRQTLQKFIIGIGPDLKNLNDFFFISFNEYFYKISSFDKSLEVLLKMYFVRVF